ncbi:hypothetical protein ANN_08613 [Periplaneta americana]|uniref:Reverse transcriptase domain-containing protein n=1 Tax=Periplaneta americana TaxID=6978 RepID=A0ABQ8T1X9_PERAM|nr:hypothetical protein ANN_08613 [Periplaneta americana]
MSGGKVHDLRGDNIGDSEQKRLRQHGFREGFSCDSQITSLVQYLAEEVDRGGRIDAVVIDFSKAFDLVPHDILIDKLSRLGIDKGVVLWIQEFLKGRTQRVTVGHEISEIGNISSGVPQGSVLGPLLFIIYVNDLCQDITSNVRLFANDCIIYRKIINNSDVDAIQTDLNNIYNWALKHRMKINGSKSKSITFCKTREETSLNYEFSGVVIPQEQCFKYLGVYLNSKLSWGEHVDNVTGKAWRALHFIMRILRKASPKSREIAYLTLVRPLMEYGTTCWDPYRIYQINSLERIQYRAAKFVKGKREDGNDTIKELKWETLENRRRKTRITSLYRAHLGQKAWVDITARLEKPTYYGRNDHDFKIKCRKQKTDVGSMKPSWELDRSRWSHFLATEFTRPYSTELLCVWSWLKSEVYKCKVETWEELLARILHACAQVKESAQISNSNRQQQLSTRAAKCTEVYVKASVGLDAKEIRTFDRSEYQNSPPGADSNYGWAPPWSFVVGGSAMHCGLSTGLMVTCGTGVESEADENPLAVEETRHRHLFSINIWAGALGHRLMEPYVLSQRLTRARYRDFLINVLPLYWSGNPHTLASPFPKPKSPRLLVMGTHEEIGLRHSNQQCADTTGSRLQSMSVHTRTTRSISKNTCFFTPKGRGLHCHEWTSQESYPPLRLDFDMTSMSESVHRIEKSGQLIVGLECKPANRQKENITREAKN